MKTFKRSVVGVAVAAALTGMFAAPGWAALNKFTLGVVIPYAIYDDTGRDTVVGITASYGLNKIYWAFIDANGNLLASDFIPTIDNVSVYSFSLSAALRGGGGTSGVARGVPGYLVMISDDDGVLRMNENIPYMSANAFLVNLNDFDAVFLPVIPLDRTDLVNSDIDLLNFPANTLFSLSNGHSGANSVWIRFLTGPGGDPRTSLIVFTPGDAPSTFQLEAFSTSGASLLGLQAPAVARRLNIINVGSIPGLAFNDGSILMPQPSNVPTTSPGYAPIKFGFVFALTRSSVVGAEQTIIGIGQ